MSRSASWPKRAHCADWFIVIASLCSSKAFCLLAIECLIVQLTNWLFKERRIATSIVNFWFRRQWLFSPSIDDWAIWPDVWNCEDLLPTQAAGRKRNSFFANWNCSRAWFELQMRSFHLSRPFLIPIPFRRYACNVTEPYLRTIHVLNLQEIAGGLNRKWTYWNRRLKALNPLLNCSTISTPSLTF